MPAERGGRRHAAAAGVPGVRAFLRGLGARSPVLLVLDDLQYAGQSTIEFVHYLAGTRAVSRLLVVVTVRAENDAEVSAALAEVASRVEVGPLGCGGRQQLAGQAGQASLADHILRQTRGHTLFVVEVLRALAEGDGGLPESLRSAVQGRTTGWVPMPSNCSASRRFSARRSTPPRWQAWPTCRPRPPSGTVNRAAGAAAGGRGRDFEFANDLIREALYATTPEPTRLAYHQRAADLLTGQPESLARHAAACGDWLRAARALLSGRR
jgi:hypothetical protein